MLFCVHCGGLHLFSPLGLTGSAPADKQHCYSLLCPQREHSSPHPPLPGTRQLATQWKDAETLQIALFWQSRPSSSVPSHGVDYLVSLQCVSKGVFWHQNILVHGEKSAYGCSDIGRGITGKFYYNFTNESSFLLFSRQVNRPTVFTPINVQIKIKLISYSVGVKG